MPLYRIEVIADEKHAKAIKKIADKFEALDCYVDTAADGGRQHSTLLVSQTDRQELVDAIQSEIGDLEGSRIILMAVEATLPNEQKEEKEQSKEDVKKKEALATREELFTQVESGADLTLSYLLLTALSTIVAAIGLVENNIAAVIGAMVIAPLLGPNLALSLSVALGERKLILKALLTGAAGIGVALVIGIAVGASGLFALDAPELLSRTDVGISGVILALSSGAAAALTMTTGIPLALVGVMVAVALLPPVAAAGIMLGSLEYAQAIGALLLLVVNIVCVNLAGLAVFVVRGVRPRTWLEKRAARQSTIVSTTVWLSMLILLVIIIVLRKNDVL
ncbi:TIGR00341 family protein [Rhizobium sp. L1K21]|uniref:TIGR00341 family protein n=1 Tax=Rhizobium sp. L1K21 TaxID=2954933 RepID=UPI0020928B8E|nr:TIGR00341 family protein [Rhizobium sp. L1K21]MCO6186064.1 TIGR00341 family protein [Rhizobium sp. L1K21]